jgi:hypothetical protein
MLEQQVLDHVVAHQIQLVNAAARPQAVQTGASANSFTLAGMDQQWQLTHLQMH